MIITPDLSSRRSNLLLKTMLRFRKTWNGPPLIVGIIGGGFSFLDIMKFPNSTKYVAGSIIPQENSVANTFFKDSFTCPGNFLADSNPEIAEYYKTNELAFPACNEKATIEFYNLLHIMFPQYFTLIINCALTSYRERKGSDRVWIMTSDDISHRTFPVYQSLKDPEEDIEHREFTRLYQDNTAAQMAYEQLLVNIGEIK